MEKLTNKQEIIFNFLREFIDSNNYPPTVREICEGIGLSSPATVHSHLSKLESKGYIKRNAQKNRAIELMVGNEPKTIISDEAFVVNVPMLGRVTAGSPIEAIETPDEYFTLPANLVPEGKEVFTLNVVGESMINAGIFDGDIVIVERQITARNGDIVVAMTPDFEVTLKTFYKEKDHIRLQPENDTLDPIILPDCRILGKAIGLYREF